MLKIAKSTIPKVPNLWAIIGLLPLSPSDEIFGGYPWFYSQKSTDNFPWAYGTKERLNLFSPDIIKYANAENYSSKRYFETIEKTPKLAGESEKETRIRKLLYLCSNWFGTSLIERSERIGIATGLEIRMPFLDNDLIEYVWNIPWEMKSLNGREKGILRSAMKGLLPKDVLKRKKSPYPKTHNPAYSAAVKQLLLETLNDTSNKITPLINKAAIETFLENDEGDLPFYGQLMKKPQICGFLLQLNFWLEHYRIGIV